MAERRMFSKTVVGSARFLRMPSTSRLLYYDLGMQADDDGVVEAFSVMRTTGATNDDLRVLASKGFVAVLNEDLVSYITDWGRNNYIQKDRYHQSVYKELLVKMQASGDSDVSCIQDVSKMDTQVRLGKDRRDRAPRFSPPSVEEVQVYCHERGSPIDPQAFVDFYTANGWKQGKGKPVVDWRACVRTWESRENRAQALPPPCRIEERDGEVVIVGG